MAAAESKVGLYSATTGQLLRTLFLISPANAYSWVNAPTNGPRVYLLRERLRTRHSQDVFAVVEVAKSGGIVHEVVRLPVHPDQYGSVPNPGSVAVGLNAAWVAFTDPGGLFTWSAATGMWSSWPLTGVGLGGFLPDGHTLVTVHADRALEIDSLDISRPGSVEHLIARLSLKTGSASDTPLIGGATAAVSPSGDVAVATGGSWVGANRDPIEIRVIHNGQVQAPVTLSGWGFQIEAALYSGPTIVLRVGHQDCYGDNPTYGVRGTDSFPLRPSDGLC